MTNKGINTEIVRSFGQIAVGYDFNPSGDPMVSDIKSRFAEIIDDLHQLRLVAEPDVARMLSIAITEAQTAQMWAVKAITWKP